MYSMKDVCSRCNLTYDTLKYYCNEGLVPNHKRGQNNHRRFDDKDVAWIEGLLCLKDCGMSIADMKQYMVLCQAGEDTIPLRKVMLEKTKQDLDERLKVITESLEYLEYKQNFYDEILRGEREYTSSLK